MNTAAKSNRIPETHLQEEVLHQWYLVVDGNIHRHDLCKDRIGFTTEGMLSEALLPEIRTVACLIAAARHNFTQESPALFTEEADWFAARILVLGVREFHLDVTLFPMLNLANRRVKAFAESRDLAFKPAVARMSLHADRPVNMLKVQLPHTLPQTDMGIIGNSLMMSRKLGKQVN